MCPEHCGHLSLIKTSTQNQYKNFKIFKVPKVGHSIHTKAVAFYVEKKEKEKENKDRILFIGKYKVFL